MSRVQVLPGAHLHKENTHIQEERLGGGAEGGGAMEQLCASVQSSVFRKQWWLNGG